MSRQTNHSEAEDISQGRKRTECDPRSSKLALAGALVGSIPLAGTAAHATDINLIAVRHPIRSGPSSGMGS
jgi:hypothetical protein